MNIKRILLDHRADTGGGNSATDAADMFAMAKRHNQMPLYERALAECWSRQRLADAILCSIQSHPIEGRAVSDSSFGQTREGQVKAGANLGDLLVNSDAFRNWCQDKRAGSPKPDQLLSFSKLLGWRDIIGNGGDPAWNQRATLLTTGLTSYQRPPGVVLLEQQPLTIAQLFAQAETTNSTVRVLKETSYTQAATAVAEEGLKPEATFALNEADFPVRKIAVIGRVTDEMISDQPAVRDYINARLGYMVQSKEDSDLLNGAGGNAITGVLNTGGIQNESAAASPSSFDAFAKALNKVRNVGFFEPDAIVMHPSDWQMMQLIRDNENRFFVGSPFDNPTVTVGGYTVAGTLWKKPVVTTTTIAQGTALVGAFRTGGQIFRRMGLTMEMTNSDASDFQYNRIAIRCETRLALAIYRPLAFCTVTGIPAAA